MNKYKLLFELLKGGKYAEFKKLLDKVDNTQINIKDDNHNYLITYAIARNNIEIVKLLLDKEAKTDIYDQEGKTILYLPIKYAYNEILTLLLHHDTTITHYHTKMVDIKDSQNNIPLHYAILFKNIYALNELLKYDSDTNSRDHNDNTSLHLATYSKNYDMCNMIIKKGVNINAITSMGESSLHIACNLKTYEIAELLLKHNIDPNIQDTNNEITALMYTIYSHNVKLFKLLLKYDASPLLQDSMGNSSIHHIIIEDNDELLHELLSKKKQVLNFNIHNIDGKLPIHLLLDKNVKDNNETKYIVEQSDLNFQDNNGNTALHLITKKHLWKFLGDIIVNKKMNIFIRNYHKVRPVDYVSKSELDVFFNLVAKSYNNVLKRMNVVWSNEWENLCKDDLYYNKLNKNNKAIINKFLDKDDDKDKELCNQIIIKKLYRLYNCNTCDANCSYPIKKGGKCIKIGEYGHTETCYFVGLSIDVLIGLLYLLNRHPNACSTINTSFIKNNKLCSYLNVIGFDTNTKCEFMNFEIIWIYKKLFFSENFIKNFKRCMDNKKIRFVIVPLGIEIEEGGHANYIIFDKNTMELERFEPYGSHAPSNYDYNGNLLDSVLSFKFNEIDSNIKYISPAKYLPKIGFQYFDVYEKRKGRIGDPSGNCAIWSIWYTDMRLTYPDYDRTILAKKLLSDIKFKGQSFKNLIRNYAVNITDVRDEIFKKANITINNWINDEYTDEQYEIIIEQIKNMIK